MRPDEEDVLAAIEEGIADLEAGRSVPHEKVVRWLRSWGKPDELLPPKCERGAA
jgi:predicted transcriptional regulator